MIYAITKNGQKVIIPSLAAALGGSYANSEIHITSSCTIPSMATVTDHTLVMDRGAVGIISDSITIACPVVMMPGSSFMLTGDLTLTGSFSASNDAHFTGDGAVTGLKGANITNFCGKADSGVTDNGPALTKAINAVVDGGEVVVPTGTYAIKTPVMIVGKTFKLKVLGTLSDNLTSFTADYTNLTNTGKGVIAISGGSVTIEGYPDANTFYGGLSVAGVNQTGRPFLYIYNSIGVYLSGIKTANMLSSAVATYACKNIRDINSYHKDGGFSVLHSRSEDVLVQGGTFIDNIGDSLVIHDRGGFTDGVLTQTRPKKIRVIGNTVVGTKNTNSYAIGITVDSSDDVNVTGNNVDGLQSNGVSNVMTMAYSFAQSENITVTGNTAKNVSVTASGSYTYCGIGFEIDGVINGAFSANSFRDVLIPHLVAKSKNITIDAVSINDVARESIIVSPSVGTSAYVVINDPTPSSNITIGGNSDGGSYLIAIGANAVIDGLHLKGLHATDYFSRGVFAASGSSVSNMTVSDCSVTEPAGAKYVFIFSDYTLNDIVINGFRAKAGSYVAGQSLFKAWKTGGNYTLTNIDSDNYDGAGLPYTQTTGLYQVTDSSFRGMPTVSSSYLQAPVGATFQRVENNFVNGVAVPSRGSQCHLITGSVVPTLNALFVGQVYLDTASLAGYVAVQIGTGATDWKKTTP